MTKTDSHIDMLAPTQMDAKIERDKVDLAYERMDEVTGRIQERFVPESSTPTALDKKREERERQTYMLSQLALETEKARLALYSDTVALANRASLLAANGIEQYQQLLNNQETQYQLALEQTARRLGDRYIFKDENGNAVYADGSAVDPDIAAGIEWNDNDMTYAQYQEWQDELNATRGKIQEYSDYESKVGAIQHQLEEGKDSMTAEEIEKAQQDIIDITPEEMKPSLDPSLSAQQAASYQNINEAKNLPKPSL